MSGAPVLAGDSAVVLGEQGIDAFAMDSAGEADGTGSSLLTEWPGGPGARHDPASISLIARGDAVFLSFDDGTVVSVHAP